MPFSSCLPFLPVPSVLPYITCFRKLFPRNPWPIKLVFLLFILYTTVLSSLSLSDTSLFFTPIDTTDLHPFSSTRFYNISRYFCIPKCLRFSTIKTMLQMQNFTGFFPEFKSNVPAKSCLLLVAECSCCQARLDLNSRVRLASFVIRLQIIIWLYFSPTATKKVYINLSSSLLKYAKSLVIAKRCQNGLRHMLTKAQLLITYDFFIIFRWPCILV
jgi:hypothetical protein